MNTRSGYNMGIALILLLGFSVSTGAQSSSLPHIILLMGDDHGWDEVGYNGHPFVKTPVLDEMSRQGLRMDRFYSAHPSCSPTRGSFLTGRHPNRYGTFAPNWSIRPEEISIAHVLSTAGYKCAHFGKWHVGPVKKESPTSPGAMGFTEWLSHDNFFEMDPVLSRNGDLPKKIQGESSEILVREAIEFLEENKNTTQPLLIVIWFGSPHEPYSGVPSDLALYQDLPDSLSMDSVRLTSNETGKAVQRPLRDVLIERYAEITAMDRSIGHLRDYLAAKSLKDNTLLWYCGDNGTPASAARTGMALRGQKGTMYEGGIRVPGIVEWPAMISSPASTATPFVTSDIMPTLATISGQSLPERPLDGIDLLPFWLDPMRPRTDPIFFWSFRPSTVFADEPEDYLAPHLQEGTTPLVKQMNGKFTRSFRNYKYTVQAPHHLAGTRVVMSGKYKLVMHSDDQQIDKVELFNLQTDAGERADLSKKNPGMVGDLQEQLRRWQQSVLTSLTEADYR